MEKPFPANNIMLSLIGKTYYEGKEEDEQKP